MTFVARSVRFIGAPAGNRLERPEGLGVLRARDGYLLCMPRAIWSGSISFGLVNIPVKLYSGVRDHKVHFHQLDKKSGSRIRYEKVAEKTGKEVDSGDIQLG